MKVECSLWNAIEISERNTSAQQSVDCFLFMAYREVDVSISSNINSGVVQSPFRSSIALFIVKIML